MYGKRPLVWFVAAYIVGMALYKEMSIVIILIACLSMLLFVIWIRIHWTGENKFKQYGFLLTLPFLLLLGYYLMNHQLEPPDIDEVFSYKINGTVCGQLEMIEEKAQYTVLTLMDNTITFDLSSNGGKSKEHNMESADRTSYSVKRVNIYSTSEVAYKIGNILSITGQIIKFQKASNPGQFNEYLYYKMCNIDYKMNAEEILVVNNKYSWFFHLLYCIKKKFVFIYAEILPEKDAGIMSAMILGEMAFLDQDIKALYQDSGISHILSISGLNVSLLGISLFHLLRKCKLSLLPCTVISILIIFSYGILTNFSVSTNRAVVMLILFMLATVIGRTYDLLSATSLSALIILIQSPLQLFNAGFLLSFGAILGIALMNPILSSLFPIKNKIMNAIWLSLSIQIITLPIITYFFFEFPTYSLIINLIILPMSSLIVLMAILAGILGCFFLPASIFFIGCVHYSLEFYELVCRTASKLPGKTYLTGKPDFMVILTYYFVILIFLVVYYSKKYKLSVFLMSFLFIIMVKSKNINLNVTFLDVGQGDGIFISTPNGTTYLIDGGSSDVSKVGQYRIEPFLKAEGVWELDYAIITHMDSDHISGLVELIERMEEEAYPYSIYSGDVVIRHLILPNISQKDESYTQLIALAVSKGVEVLYIEKGDIIKEGEVTMTCLHPGNAYYSDSANAYSTVLSVNYNQFDLLLTGDLEGDGEKLVMNMLKYNKIHKSVNYNNVVTDFDVLKVAHHGSKYSTGKDLLQMLKPEFAIISCGKENRYGHPHKELIDRLDAVNCDISLTTVCGAIRFETDGESLKLNKYLN